ncbi:MAG: diguanylate cyclase [Frankiales bacterium]|nr:diguanylate cyclase [Frankiales bacterium]
MRQVGSADVLLLVEDDPDHAFLVRRSLRSRTELDLEVVHLRTCAEATARVAAGDVACVLLDLTLPDAQGLEALTQLRAVDPTVPVVVLTGLDSGPVGLQALQHGAQDYLVKGQHAPDGVVRAVLFAIERSSRQQAEHSRLLLDDRLQLREAQLSEAQRLARMGSWEWDLVTGAVAWSDELKRLTGIDEATSTDAFDRYLELVPVEERRAVAELFSAEAAADPPVRVRHRLRRADGGERWVQGHMTAAGWDEDGEPVRVLGTMQDVTQQKTVEDLLAHQALHDGLTGLVTRGVLLDRLSRVLAAPSRGGDGVAVVFLDLDRFKWVNDNQGHSSGDRLLVAVARRLEAQLRPSDTLARFGGDEFVVLCEKVGSEEHVVALVERLLSALVPPFLLDGQLEPLQVSASAGVAVARPGEGVEAELLVRDADIAMYRAKERGRARLEVFDTALRDRATARLGTQRDLSAALGTAQIEVHHQPVVDLLTGRVTGSEALVRWRHPTRGLLTPDEFVPHAEESGLIVPLGAAVLLQACATAARWNRRRTVPLALSVNLSARQLSAPDLLQTVEQALGRSGLAPQLLCLEVTETAVMSDADMSVRVLGELRRLGVRVAVDDFGTGYSSLAYLLSLPVDVLKVDRSFVGVVEDGGRGTAIVEAVLALAAALRLGVVAEGVETARQRDVLAGLGVVLGQGFLWGKAVAAADADWASGVPRARTPWPVAEAGPTWGQRQVRS